MFLNFIFLLFLFPLLIESGGNLHQLHVTSKSVSSFLDDFAQRYVGSSVPGMVVSVVRDSKTLFSGGFGRAANLEGTNRNHLKMNQHTLVKIGSVSKLVTSVALMQLLDEGKIQNLSDPIELYLPGAIPNGTAGSSIKGKISFHHILTHSTGIEEKRLGYLIPRSKNVNITSFLQEFPKRVHPPSIAFTYNHHAYCLVAPLIQSINDQTFEEYMREKVFLPLNMQHSTFAPYDLEDPVMKLYLQKDPSNNKKSSTYQNIATGYVKQASGSFITAPELHTNAVPASGLSTTASDMAHFLKMMLNEGYYKKQVLSSTSTTMMLNRQYSVHPEIDGSAYGWVERYFTNGVRVLLHGGDLPGFSSLAFLIPSENIGCFVTMNTNDPYLRSTFLSEFVKKFSKSPSDAVKEDPPRSNLPSTFSFDGYYRPMRSAYTSFEHVQSIFGQLKVSKKGNTLLLTLSPFFMGSTSELSYELIPQTQDVFTVSSGKPHPQERKKVAFIQGNEDSPTMLVTNVISEMPLSFERVSFFSSYHFVLTSWCICMVTFTIFLVSWILLGLFRKIETVQVNSKFNSLSRINLAISASSKLEILVALVSSSYLLFYGLLISAFWKYGIDEIMSETRLPTSLRVLFFFPFLSQIFTISLLCYLFQDGYRHSVSRVAESSVVCLVSFVMMYLQYELNLWIFLAI